MERFWLKHYPPGVPHDVDLGQYASLIDLFDDGFLRHASRSAYAYMDRFFTFADVDRYSNAFGAWLQQQGLARGARVAIMMPNVVQYPIALAGVLRAGCVVVNVNPLYTPRELEHQLRDSGAEAIVILENFAATLQQVIAKTAVRHVVVASLGDMLGFPKGAIVNFAVRKLRKMVPAYSLPDHVRFTAALDAGARRKLEPVRPGPQDVAFLQYTGGTTGVSKGAILTHRNLVANVLQAEAWVRSALEDDASVVAITALPLYHIFALTANSFTMLKLGAHNVMIPNPRDFPGFVRVLAQYPFTFFAGVNTLFNALLHTPGFDTLDFSRLRVSLGGGMAVQRAVAEQWKRVTGSVLTQAWGLTETSPAATINRPGDDFNGSIGLPISSTVVTIRDDAGNELPLGQSGEICVEGPQVMRGYWNRPDETEKVMLPGQVLRTGDIGYMDPRGFVFIEDRKKDMILVSGFNVYPNEVEGVAVTHPGVLEVAAVAQPDERAGEVVALFVVRKDPSLTEEQLIEYCRGSLTGYKVPKRVYFRDELPKTNVGKILRRSLKEEIGVRPQSRQN